MTSQKESKSWNLGADYFKSIGMLNAFLLEQRLTRNVEGWLEGLRAMFNRAAPYCWDSPKDEERLGMRAELDELGRAMYTESDEDEGLRSTVLFDELDAFEARLLQKMKEEEVLAPLYSRADPYNQP